MTIAKLHNLNTKSVVFLQVYPQVDIKSSIYLHPPAGVVINDNGNKVQYKQANLSHEDTNYDYSKDDQDSHSGNEENESEDEQDSYDEKSDTASQDDQDLYAEHANLVHTPS